MSKKLTIEFVRESFAKEGYTLLSEVYVNAHSTLDYICSKGHKHVTSWTNWYSSKKCPSCAKNRKPTFEEVLSSFTKEGYTLLSTEYKTAKTRLYYKCPFGNLNSIVWNNWQQGYRCPCAFCNKYAKLTIEQVRESFEKEGYILLSIVYVNSNTKLDYICSNGHKHSIVWDNWKQGKRCPECFGLRRFGKTNPAWLGGLSFEEYCEAWKDDEYKQDIRERDGHKCLNPYCNKEATRLNIHHINYNKKDCHFKNLITVCASCNAKANIDREWHQDWYQALLHNRYGYNY